MSGDGHAYGGQNDILSTGGTELGHGGQEKLQSATPGSLGGWYQEDFGGTSGK